MKYENARKKEIGRTHECLIDEFARTYKLNRPTVLLIPGGMGSQIDRSKKPYQGAASLPFRYDPIWMDKGIVFDREALQLEILPNNEDIDRHICIPNGPLRFLLKPYNATKEYFDDRDYNYLVFGFDWRRSIQESAGFLQFFLERLKNRVMDLHQEDPLPNTTILGHSMGGLVAKVFLHRVFKAGATAADIPRWMSRLVTVATPFYGTATHMTRYYKGQNLLNRIYTTKKMARLTGTLRGPYILMPLDKKTYNRYADKLEIRRYPVRDEKKPTREADPFDPRMLSRYPSWVDENYLKAAIQVRNIITRPLPPAVVNRVFHIRAIQRRTWVELRWKAVKGATFNPNKDDSPISGKTGPGGGGDGTVPFWSARLVQIPDNQVYTLKKAKNHQELLEHPETLRVVRRLIENNKMPKSVKALDKALGGPRASLKAAENFMDKVADGQIERTDIEAADKKVWRRIIQEVNLC
jgi:pimeloyl-ACP methyl ester carboxylesterase